MDKKCYLCNSKEKHEVKFGEFMTRGKISVHYFCLLLSSNLMQNGKDNEGFLGFLPKDIQKEADRVRQLICYYCRKPSANISCCASKCHKSFHLTCGDKNSTEHNFVGTFQSFCHHHVKGKKRATPPLPDEKCCICYDDILAPGKKFDTVNMIKAPCCKNGWFHKYCLASFAKTAGYFFKCPLCNDSKVFRQRLAYKSIFIPDRDAAWELEPNAFSELLERPNTCSAVSCSAEGGRKSETKRNEFFICCTCGSVAIHRLCMTVRVEHFFCDECASITAVIESKTVVNITPTKSNNHDEEDEEIDVGDDFDVGGVNNCVTQVYYEEEDVDEPIKPMRITKKRYVISDSDSTETDEDSDEDDEFIKSSEKIKSNKYTIDEDSKFLKESNDIASSRNSPKKNNSIFYNELSDKQTTTTACERQKHLSFNTTESFFDSGEDSDHSGISAYKCGSNGSSDTTTSSIWDKSELKVCVHVKKLKSREIKKRANRRFMSLSEDKNESKIKVRPNRSFSDCTEPFCVSSEKEKDFVSKKVETEIHNNNDRYSRQNDPDNSFSNNNFTANETTESPYSGGITSKISPMRLRSLSEDNSKKCPRHLERRRSLIHGFYSLTPIHHTTDMHRSKRHSELLESASIKRSRLDFSTDNDNSTVNEQHSNNLTVIYEDENKFDRTHLTDFKRRKARGRSPLSANLCDLYTYPTLPYVKKAKTQNGDKTAVGENLPDVGNIFSKNKPNIPQSKYLEQTTPSVKGNAIEDRITNQDETTTEIGYKIFDIFISTDKSKNYKPKIKRSPSLKPTKGLSIPPSNQTKIEAFFKRR